LWGKSNTYKGKRKDRGVRKEKSEEMDWKKGEYQYVTDLSENKGGGKIYHITS